MSNKILFVDDDVTLLTTMERNLSLDFDVSIAAGGDAAIEIFQRDRSYSVVFVDMQMPKRNGIQTIAALREINPDAVFVMLTGNQDQSTAIEAINEGHVFRFLNKPCEISEVKAAIEVAQKQHNLIIAERELLEGTFTGSISLMTDIIEMNGSGQIDTGRMAESLQVLAKSAQLEIGWEEKAGARIFLVGVTMLSKSDALDFATLDPVDSTHLAIFSRICRTSASMVQKIPRLGWIADVLRTVPSTEQYSHSDDRADAAAALLRVVFYWNLLTCRGLSADEATTTINKIMPNMNDRLLQGLSMLPDNQDIHAMTSVAIGELEEGMIMKEDIRSASGDRLVAGGRRLTAPMIENLCRMPDVSGQQVSVIVNSCPALGMN